MAAKKKKKDDKPKKKELLTVESTGGSADGNGNIYCGKVGGYNLGSVVAPNKTAARKKLLDAFNEIRITPKMMTEFLGHTTKEITLPEFQELRGVYRALKEGTTNWKELMEVKKAKNAPKAAQEAEATDDPDPTRGSK